ncbi:MAG: hypothetical protein Tsb0021_13550 [Chlamydiales bacterium]
MSMQQSSRPTPSYWVKIFILAVIIGSGATAYFFLNHKPALEQVVEKQLKALKNQDYSKAYYEYTSKNYQKKHSFEQFKNFVRINPLLSQNAEIIVYDHHLNNGTGTLTVSLQSEQGDLSSAIYLLEMDNSEWKIGEIEILGYGASRGTEDDLRDIAMTQINQQNLTPEIQEMINIIQKQLEALQEKDLNRAYEQYSSRQFKEGTSFVAFENFIRNFPELIEHTSATFNRAHIEGNRGSVTATMITPQGSYPIEYIMIDQDGSWKVWGFRILAPIQTQSTTTNVSTSDQTGLNPILDTILRDFLQELKEGDSFEAYDTYTATEFRAATSYEQFQNFLLTYPELQNYDFFTLNPPQNENGLVSVKIDFLTYRGTSIASFWLIQEDDEWKIWGIKIEESASYPPLEEDEKQALMTVLEDQLEALRNRDYSKAYYAYVSDEFEKSTSLEEFKDFIRSHPLFMDYTTIEEVEGIKEGKIRLLRIRLQNQNQSSYVDYRFVKRAGDWKVWGIQILRDPDSDKLMKEKEQITITLNHLLEAIRQLDISKAYYAYGSGEFKDTVSKDEFGEFIKNHPIIENSVSAQIYDIEILRGVATSRVLLETEQEESELFEIKLIREDGKWRILSVQSLHKNAQAQPTELIRVLMGTELDENGIVDQAATVFSPEDQELYFSLFLKNSKELESLKITLKHMESGSESQPVSEQIEENGDSIVTFSFTAPQRGWPVGNYRVHIQSDDGIDQEVQFTILKEIDRKGSF